MLVLNYFRQLDRNKEIVDLVSSLTPIERNSIYLSYKETLSFLKTDVDPLIIVAVPYILQINLKIYTISNLYEVSYSPDNPTIHLFFATNFSLLYNDYKITKVINTTPSIFSFEGYCEFCKEQKEVITFLSKDNLKVCSDCLEKAINGLIINRACKFIDGGFAGLECLFVTRLRVAT